METMSTTPFTVKVLEQCRIKSPPNTVPNTSILPLTFFDLPWLFFSPTQPLFFYELPHSPSHFTTTIVPKLKKSLSFTLQHYYPYAGRFVPSSDLITKPHITYTDDMSVEFTISESNGDFKQFCSNHPRDAKDFHLLVPKLASSISSSEGKEFPLLAIQVTLFPNVGICIGLACHTVVADGRTFHNFMKTWASYCTFGSASAFPTNSLPFCDRSVIVDEKGLEEVFLEEWTKRRLVKNIAIGREANLVDLSSMVRATFSMSITQMEKMKLLIINYCKEKNKPRLEPVRLTSYVLICAFVWVCLVKTHQSVNEKVNHEDPTYFGFIAGGMTRLDYPVQQTYLGNCVGFYRASERREELLGENGIAVAAIAIVSVVKKLDALYFDGAEKWILDWEVLHGSEQHVHAVWSPKLKFYELDFGWGRPKKIEEVSIDHTRAVSVIHSREFEGEIEIGLALPKSKMDVFSSLFTQGLSALL